MKREKGKRGQPVSSGFAVAVPHLALITGKKIPATNSSDYCELIRFLATHRIEPANLDFEVDDLSSTPSQGI